MQSSQLGEDLLLTGSGASIVLCLGNSIVLSLQIKQNVLLTTYLHLIPRLGMCTAESPLLLRTVIVLCLDKINLCL